MTRRRAGPGWSRDRTAILGDRQSSVLQGGTTVAEHPDSDRERRFRQLYDAQYWTIRAYALRRTSQPADADEIVAAVFVTAWQHRDVPLDSSHQRVWLLGVARKTLANQRRAARRRWRLTERLKATTRPPEHGLLGPDPAGLPAPDPDSPLADLEGALAGLSESDRELLLLHLWEDLNHAELAAVFGITPNAVAIRLHRARQKLRDKLQRSAGPEPSVPAGPTEPSRAQGEVTNGER
jgi:RNA polymerase sigma-70 factor (ECF subfamily)